MKRLLLPALAAAMIFTSCKKDKDAPAEILLLQQADFFGGIMNFSYNEQNMISKVSIASKPDEGPSKEMGYIEYAYSNGKPATADFYLVNNTEKARMMAVKFNIDPQGRIAYAARVQYNGEGQETIKDTMFMTFNTSNLMTSLKIGSHSENALELSYTAQGNLIFPPSTETDNNNRHTDTYEFRYDNKPNPYRTNGLGYLLVPVAIFEFFNPGQLLSSNNLTYMKYVYKREEKVEGQFTEKYREEEVMDRVISYDEFGGLKKVDVTETYKEFESNVQTDSHNETRVENYICIKKRL